MWRERKWTIIVLATLVLMLIGSVVGPPPSNLTPEQEFSIAMDCAENPDTWRCQ